MGIVGVGFLAIPTLAGSTAYAFAETWDGARPEQEINTGKAGFMHLILALNRSRRRLGLHWHKPCESSLLVRRSQWFIAPFLLVGILIVASDKKLMQGQPSSRFAWMVVAIAALAMVVAGVAMFVV